MNYILLLIELVRVLPKVIEAFKGKDRKEIKPIVNKAVGEMGKKEKVYRK